MERLSDVERNEALKIFRHVVENGRVQATDGEFDQESVEVEVEFEAIERGFDSQTAAAMAAYAAGNHE